MALIKDGKYIRISKEYLKSSLETVIYNIYRSKEVRVEGLSEFDIAPQKDSKIQVTDELLNLVITELYNGLKLLPEFEGAIDD